MKKYWLVGLLAVIALSMAITRFRYRDYKWPVAETLLPQPSPTTAPSLDANYPLWKLLPHQGKDFVVERYVEPLTLSITTNNKNEKLLREEIYKWMKENKVATESHQLIFNYQ